MSLNDGCDYKQHKNAFQEFSLELWEWVWSSLEQECQPSIRHMLEWLAMSAINQDQQLGGKLWLLFDKVSQFLLN